MIETTWGAILGSSLLAAIAGGIIAGFFTLRVAHDKYVNDYYRTVVQRRLGAYEQLENLITTLKTSVADDKDNRVYHLLFSSGDNTEAHKALFFILSQSMWLSDDVVNEAIALNRLLFNSHDESGDPYRFAKDHYKEIADTRTRLERLHARDFMTLHDVKTFLKSKKPSDSYEPLPSRG